FCDFVMFLLGRNDLLTDRLCHIKHIVLAWKSPQTGCICPYYTIGLTRDEYIICFILCGWGSILLNKHKGRFHEKTLYDYCSYGWSFRCCYNRLLDKETTTIRR